MENEKILYNYSDREKGAYLGAIASIATADRQASETELEYLDALADTAGLSAEQKEAVASIANGISPGDLQHCLDVLKSSDLKYSLITDLIAFAKSDASYSGEEKDNIDKIAQYLGVNHDQVAAVNRLVDKVAESPQPAEEISKPGFLDSLGLGNIFGSSGPGGSNMAKNILGIAGPMLLGALLSRGMRGRHGGGLGGMMGGAGNMLGTGAGMAGLGGLFSMLSGGRGFRNAGGLLSNIFGR